MPLHHGTGQVAVRGFWHSDSGSSRDDNAIRDALEAGFQLWLRGNEIWTALRVLGTRCLRSYLKPKYSRGLTSVAHGGRSLRPAQGWAALALRETDADVEFAAVHVGQAGNRPIHARRQYGKVGDLSRRRVQDACGLSRYRFADNLLNRSSTASSVSSFFGKAKRTRPRPRAGEEA